MVTQRGDGMLGFHPYFDIRHDYGDRGVSCRRRPHFGPKEIPLVLLCVRGWVDPLGYWMRTESWGHLKISKDPNGNRARDTPSYGTMPQPTALPLAVFRVVTMTAISVGCTQNNSVTFYSSYCFLCLKYNSPHFVVQSLQRWKTKK